MYCKPWNISPIQDFFSIMKILLNVMKSLRQPLTAGRAGTDAPDHDYQGWNFGNSAGLAIHEAVIAMRSFLHGRYP